MTRQRDLSGFGVKPSEPQARPRSQSPETDSTLVPPPSSRANVPTKDHPGSSTSAPETHPNSTPRAKKAAKQRVTLSLPTQVATMLRATADTEQRIFLDIILSAFVSHADDVENDLLSDRSRVGPTGSRRRAGSGRTQIPLNILKEDLKVLDLRVKALNMDRSTYVAELLVRELKR